MKKLISILLLINIIVSSIAYVGFFSFFQNRIKKEMKYAIKHSLKDQEITMLSIRIDDPNYKKLEKNEFLFHNEMYDVIEMQIQDGTMKIRCINDRKEKELFKNLNEMVSNNLNTEGTKGNRLSKLFSSISYFLLHSESNSTVFPSQNIQLYSYYIFSIIPAFLSIPDPPPRNIV